MGARRLILSSTTLFHWKRQWGVPAHPYPVKTTAGMNFAAQDSAQPGPGTVVIQKTHQKRLAGILTALMDGWIHYLVLGLHSFACLFVLKRSSCKTVEWNTVSESIQNFREESFLLTMQFLELSFISLSHGKVYFHLVKKPQLFFFQVHFLLHKVYFSLFQQEFVKTAYGARSTRPLPPISPGVKNGCLFA